eukprot:Hpha_TRINITY_DN15998_c0_g2::TRINITY_DN15998_c0_g2_i1::g.73012::m.73012
MTEKEREALPPEETDCASICRQWKQDFVDYWNEYRCISTSSSAAVEAAAAIRETCQSADVALYVKPGCGFCKRARGILDGQGAGDKFTVVEKEGNDIDVRSGLERIVGRSVTFPVVFIKGQFVGGSDDLFLLVEEKQFERLVAEPNQEPHGDTDSVLTKPRLCQEPRRYPVYLPHLYVYTNIVRIESLVHTILFAIALATHDDNPGAAKVMLWVVLVDCILWTLWGASPFSPLGTFFTWALWKHRGESAISIPYKVIFIIYAVELGRNLIGDGEPPGKGTLITFTVNSALLAVLRF